MYKLSVYDYFSAAHRLRGYEGPCSNVHGHNWKVKVTFQTDTLDSLGMAIDFKVLKAKLWEILNQLDHTFLNELPIFKDINPTSENIARYIFESISESFKGSSLSLLEVELQESDKVSVIYSNA
ncbi:MAG TPA: 6-carboxytetrahydropterin synthase QueD [Candidatus Syntrophosphaera sp.]|nr:6-carboxytetrahydropterin synthase QueD [Candidatus Syntrophosphaera sp.]HON31956.1 6-carboxytetrahydropterin synthase QueD [Candidatus Syntrophosphaera thermopropionivorans]HQH47011.1 6-carboxytetrahydropterin synthase QueD [Candidatus Syntrophosphaera thermopropionivorans]HRQ98545.1 6-carboxytetrahydropterin synthase QueD [Candidatus Syntrophosphaera sp.]HRR97106.1 6-carboxytetrahydropterin synthase QueD [Candidatus Syntrophosphaera sp.]